MRVCSAQSFVFSVSILYIQVKQIPVNLATKVAFSQTLCAFLCVERVLIIM